MSTQIDAIEDFVKEFKAHDLKGIRTHLHVDYSWIDQTGAVVVQGPENFLNLIEGLWKENPKLSISNSPCIQVGNLVSHTETIVGYEDGHKEEYIWVYEFKGNVIVKMFGFQSAI